MGAITWNACAVAPGCCVRPGCEYDYNYSLGTPLQDDDGWVDLRLCIRRRQTAKNKVIGQKWVGNACWHHAADYPLACMFNGRWLFSPKTNAGCITMLMQQLVHQSLKYEREAELESRDLDDLEDWWQWENEFGLYMQYRAVYDRILKWLRFGSQEHLDMFSGVLEQMENLLGGGLCGWYNQFGMDLYLKASKNVPISRQDWDGWWFIHCLEDIEHFELWDVYEIKQDYYCSEEWVEEYSRFWVDPNGDMCLDLGHATTGKKRGSPKRMTWQGLARKGSQLETMLEENVVYEESFEEARVISRRMRGATRPTKNRVLHYWVYLGTYIGTYLPTQR
jgi:hypothetical protein